MWIEREIVKSLLSLAQTFPVVVLTGPRQTGKTSIIEKTFPGYNFVSLDYPSAADSAESRPREFLEKNPTPLIIDEVQYAPGIFRYLKTVVDSRRGETGLFVLTGSQSFQLMESVSESLAGRAAIVPFLGFSATEWLYAQTHEAADCVDFLWKGSFPALWASIDHPPNRDRWYQGYVAGYLERDVRNLLNVGSLRDFERFLRAAAARTGKTLNMSEVGRDVGISPTTAKQWFSVLLTSNQIMLLEPYYRSLGKRIVKSPKLYFTDTGLAAFLAGFASPQALVESPFIGAFWENHVVCQWLRWKDWHQPSASLWFWQDRTHNEVDLLIELNQKIFPIDCKWNEHPDVSDTKGIAMLTAMYGDMVAPASIACLTDDVYDIADNITARPGWVPWNLQ